MSSITPFILSSSRASSVYELAYSGHSLECQDKRPYLTFPNIFIRIFCLELFKVKGWLHRVYLQHILNHGLAWCGDWFIATALRKVRCEFKFSLRCIANSKSASDTQEIPSQNKINTNNKNKWQDFPSDVFFILTFLSIYLQAFCCCYSCICCLFYIFYQSYTINHPNV